MKISMLTTTFPKFLGDSHGPWILAMSKSLVSAGYGVRILAPSASDLKSNGDFLPIEVSRFRYFFKPLEQVAYGANIPTNVQTNKIAKLGFPFFVGGFFVAAIKCFFKSDLIHAQFGYSGVFLAAAKTFLRNKTPMIISFYGRDVAQAFKYPKLYQYAFKQAEKILVLSNDMKNNIILAGCPADKVIVHHLGVDLSQFDSLHVKKELQKSSLTLLIVANFVKKKGIHFAIQAFAQVLQKRAATDSVLHLKIVGQGPEEDNLKNVVKQYGLEKHVVFVNNYLSPQPRQVVVDAMREADIFILPSEPIEHDYGGTPVVLMEASAMKLPVVTTQDAGNGEIILHQKTGYVVPPKDVDKLALAMENLVADSALRARFGEAGALHIQTEFNHLTQMEKLKQIYTEILE